MPKATSVRNTPQREVVDYAGRQLFAGLDLAARSWKVTVRTRELFLRSASVPASPDALLAFFGHHFSGAAIQLVYEAGCFGYWIRDELEDAGIDVVVVAPHLLPSDLVKTDRLDSRKLARLLASGLLRSIWIPTAQQRMDRAVVRHRTQLVRARGRLQDQIKKLVLFHGIRASASRARWSTAYAKELGGIEFPEPTFRATVRGMLDEHRLLTDHIRRQERLIQELAGTDRYAHQLALLRTIPGVGLLTAITALVELQDVSRFESGARMVSYLGLSPQQRSTGDCDRRGHITKAGNQFLRHALVELAWRTIRRDPALLAKYESIRSRRGAKIAIVAIARRLAIRIRTILLEDRAYEIGRAA